MTTRCSILVGRKKTVFDTDAHENKRKKASGESNPGHESESAPPVGCAEKKERGA